MLDLFCGRWGWSRAFAARGWDVTGIDLVEPAEIPKGCRFLRMDVLALDSDLWCDMPDFICASSPCEGFSVWGMRHFHPKPPYPEMAIKLFNHTRSLCEDSGVAYVMENVRAAQQFVGQAVSHCGPFYLWGNAVPPLLGQGISKAKWKSNSYHGRDGKPGNFAPRVAIAEKRSQAAAGHHPSRTSQLCL